MNMSIRSFSEGVDRQRNHRQECVKTYTHTKTDTSQDQRSVALISGAGPAGLNCALRILQAGGKVVVIEKRSERYSRRPNVIQIKGRAYSILCYAGVVGYLREHGKIFQPENTIDEERGMEVKIGDLEEALLAVLLEVAKETPEGTFSITYDASIESIQEEENEHATITIKKKDGSTFTQKPDFLIIAEGAHSTAAQQLDRKRVEVLPAIPIVTTGFKDLRPPIQGVGSAVLHSIYTLYLVTFFAFCHLLFLVRFVYTGELWLGDSSQIRGSLNLSVPGHTQTSCYLNEEESKKLENNKKNIEEKKRYLDELQSKNISDNDPTILQTKQELEQAKKSLNQNSHFWSLRAFCLFNWQTAFYRIWKGRWLKDSPPAPLTLSFQKTDLPYSFPSRMEPSSQLVGKTIVLAVGDARGSTDPVTGAGCASTVEEACKVAALFGQFLTAKDRNFIDSNQDKEQKTREACVKVHQYNTETILDELHSESKKVRTIFRPDTVPSTTSEESA